MPADDIERFYELLAVSRRTGGPRRLADCTGRSGWLARGVYFFFEDGEAWRDGSLRVVRVGTHALKVGSRTTLWKRVSQHRGNVGGRNAGGGNHRGSIFRLRVGACLLVRDGDPGGIAGTWGQRSSGSAEIRAAEVDHERRVSAYIGAMPFLWLDVDDEPGPLSDRGTIESGSIALLSGLANPGVDLPSERWVGRYSDRPAVAGSGLWNVNHTADTRDARLVPTMERWVGAATR